MKGLNRVTLLGNLTRDPEVRQAGSTNVCKMGLATNESYKKDGQWVDKAEYHTLVAWSKLADIAGQYLRKGSEVYVEGKLQTRKWQDADGKDRWSTEVVVRDLKMFKNGEAKPQSSSGPPTNFDDDIPF